MAAKCKETSARMVKDPDVSTPVKFSAEPLLFGCGNCESGLLIPQVPDPLRGLIPANLQVVLPGSRQNSAPVWSGHTFFPPSLAKRRAQTRTRDRRWYGVPALFLP